MKVTKLSFFRYIRKKDIVVLLKYLENYSYDELHLEDINEAAFLYTYYKRILESSFEPLTVIQYIYLFLPQKYARISTISLSDNIQELKSTVLKHEEAYAIKQIGNHQMFAVLEEIEGFRLLKTRSDVWLEAIDMQNFLSIYRYWSPSWERMRAVGKFSTPEIDFTMELRRIGSRVIIIEAKERSGVAVTGKPLMRMQRAINQKQKELRQRERELSQKELD